MRNKIALAFWVATIVPAAAHVTLGEPTDGSGKKLARPAPILTVNAKGATP